MAESAPVNDVLCGAVDYLVRLGSNLRQRSESLKNKRFTKDKLRNTHAVQKAADKVLLICELSKKSIGTVEQSVKTILSQIAKLQSNIGGKSSSSEDFSQKKYFVYNSRRLKIRKKVNIKHYMSAKVAVSQMPASVIEKYPVFYDCKLFKLRKKDNSMLNLNPSTSKRTDSSDSNKKKEKSVKFSDNIIDIENRENEEHSSTNEENDNTDISSNKQKENNDSKKVKNYSLIKMFEDDIHQSISEKRRSSKSEGSKERSKNIHKESYRETKTKDLGSVDKSKHESVVEEISTESSQCNTDEIKNNDALATENNPTRETPTIQNVDTICEDSKNYESDRSVDSNSSKKSFIKCVDITKLLKPEKIPKVLPPVVIYSDSDEDSNSKRKYSNKYKSSRSNNSKSKSNKLKDKRRESEEYWQEKRKEVENFKPKNFSINVIRLPNLTIKYLESQKLKRIIQNDTVVCELETKDLTQTTEKRKNSEEIEAKSSLLNDSDSENTDEEIKNVNKIVKQSLLCDSDSDKENSSTEGVVNGINKSNDVITEPDVEKDENDTRKDKNNTSRDDVPTSKDSDSDNSKKNKNLSSLELLRRALPDSDSDDNKEEPKSPQTLDSIFESLKKSDGDNSRESPSKERMQVKKMLLTHSSSSDNESNRSKIKDDLLKSDNSSNDEKAKSSDHSSHSEKAKSSESDSSNSIKKSKKLSKKRARKRLKSNSSDEDGNLSDENISTAKKMEHSNGKSSSGSQQSNSEDSDKDINGLTNLRTLRRSRRQRSRDRSRRMSRMAKMPKVPVLNEEALLQADSASDAASLGSNEDCQPEDLPTVPVSNLNGDGDILAKEDLLADSDSSSNPNKSSQDDKEAETDEENMKLKRRKANAISSDSEAGSSRKKDERISDFEDSEDDGSEPVKKSKRKRNKSDSDTSVGASEDGKKKRRRIKNIDDSDGSGSETENEGRNKHGRKNIRKVMGKDQLEEATKKAAREEKERIARIAERQKLYNNLQFDESGKPDEVILDKVVLDFDPETKEPIIEVDKGLVKKLKPHQANGIKFMWDACFESVKRIKKGKGSGCILAHCMGLGKTLQVVSLTHTLLTHSDLTSVNRVLVVCPLSTVLNWVNEFKMWLKHAVTDYEVDVYELSRFKQNSDRAYQLSQWFQHGGVCVLGYEMFRNLSADNTKKFKKKMLKSFQESLVDPGPDLVVCDEGHLLKNEKTSLSQAMNKVKTLRRIVLTGTPLQNNLKEYYCMVQFVKPNLLGKYNEYLNRFVNPITNGQYTDSTEHDIKIMKRRSHVLHKMLDGAVQRRDYGVLAPFLPPKHEYVLFITLTEVQIKLYTHYLENYSRRPLPGKSSGFLFPDFQSLQRIWTHPLVLKYNSERYEIMQQKKREREEEDSEGSLVDFINDSSPEETSTEESTDESSEMSDDSRKKSKKKSSPKKNKPSTRRGTRANPIDQEDDDVQEVEIKNENPTEWWMSLVNEEELEDMRNSHKLVLLFDILRQCEAIGDKLLVFSQSLYSLDLIEHFLGKVDEATQEGRVDEKLGGHVGSWSPGVDYFRLDGSTSCENRSIWCKNFNREDNPRARLFLISTRAGGLGINLVAANRVVIFDVSWNPSHDVQSIFRVYRFGQKKPCYIYRFLAMGTMEEKIYERQVTKQAISKRVIDEQQIDRHYAENDLAELYKFEPTPPQPRPLPPLPKDRLFAEMLKEHEQLIYKYHEHDSLLENKEEETLTEEERKAAWEDFENEKTRPPPTAFASPYMMHNGMMSGMLAQQQLAYATIAGMLRKEAPTLTENQIRDMIPLLYGANPQLMQKMSEMYKYPQSGMVNPAMMNVMNPGGGGMGMGGSSGLQYEPPWQRQQQMRLQQIMQQQNSMGAKYYAGGLGSRDPVAMALQHQRAREMMLGERPPRGRPPARPAPPTDVVNLDSD